MLKPIIILTLILAQTHLTTATDKTQIVENQAPEKQSRFPNNIPAVDKIITNIKTEFVRLSAAEMKKHARADRYEDARERYEKAWQKASDINENHPALAKFDKRIATAQAEYKRLKAEGITDQNILDIAMEEGTQAMRDRIAASKAIPEIIKAEEEEDRAEAAIQEAADSYALETERGKMLKKQITDLEEYRMNLVERKIQLESKLREAKQKREELLNKTPEGRQIQKALKKSTKELETIGE